MHAFLALLNVGTMLLYRQEEIVSKREKQMKLTAIDNNGTLQGFMLVKSCDRKNTKNGSVYLDLVLADGDGDVVAKIWDFRGTAADAGGRSRYSRFCAGRAVFSRINVRQNH